MLNFILIQHLFWSLELGMEETLANLQALDGDQVAAACRTTLSILVQNAMENVENKIFEVLDIIAEKVPKINITIIAI